MKVEEGPKSKKTKGGKKKKSKKALKSDQSAGGDIDEEEGFKTPSRNFQVKAEANKERKHDPGLVKSPFLYMLLVYSQYGQYRIDEHWIGLKFRS